PDVLRLSDLLSNFELGIKIIDEPEDQRISSRMDAGNKARSEARRGDFLAIAAVAEISRKRDKRKPAPFSKTAYIFVSLKRPEEVSALRRIYGPGFYLIGISTTRDERRKYLHEDKNIESSQVDALI